jgi:hypothetical protein
VTEDGAGVFDDYWRDAKEKIGDRLVTDGATGEYSMLIAVLHFFNENFNPNAGEEEEDGQ